jgi:hypothetical protein
MKNISKLFLSFLATAILLSACKEKEYVLGDLKAPTNLVITTVVKGVTTATPNGDGSGDVTFTVSADNALSYKIDYDATNALDLVYLPTGTTTKKYTTLGTNTYKVTAVAYGRGGTSTTITKDITVQSNFTPDAAVVANLTGGSSKTWIVDKSVGGHFGVGPFTGSIVPEWWAASVNEKVTAAPCFYTAGFKFTAVSASSYTLQVTTPDGAFTKTGANATLAGIPGSGDEGCYAYAGGTSNFSFIPASSAVPAANSTRTSILLAGTNTFIGYGSLQKEYEILSISATAMYLRVQGTETGNAWYIKLKAL